MRLDTHGRDVTDLPGLWDETDTMQTPPIEPPPFELSREPAPPAKPKNRATAGTPGKGPAGETCKTCKHLRRIQLSKTYLKCGLMRRFWTGGAATDIRARYPACEYFEKEGPPLATSVLPAPPLR